MVTTNSSILTWTQSTSRHRRLWFFGQETREELQVVDESVESLCARGDLLVRVPFLERRVRLETQEVSELVESAKIPFLSCLDDSHNVYRTKPSWSSSSLEATSDVLGGFLELSSDHVV